MVISSAENGKKVLIRMWVTDEGSPMGAFEILDVKAGTDRFDRFFFFVSK
jgi:hypothetical protein